MYATTPIEELNKTYFIKKFLKRTFDKISDISPDFRCNPRRYLHAPVPRASGMIQHGLHLQFWFLYWLFYETRQRPLKVK
jgi:hypothetical protein